MHRSSISIVNYSSYRYALLKPITFHQLEATMVLCRHINIQSDSLPLSQQFTDNYRLNMIAIYSRTKSHQIPLTSSCGVIQCCVVSTYSCSDGYLTNCL